MPNGTPDVSGVPIPIPTDPEFFEDPLSFGILGDIGRAIAGFFGGGGRGVTVTPQVRERDVRLDVGRAALPRPRKTDVFTFSGKSPILTPGEGGPPLVTERFQDLPGPFVDPGLGILPFELRAIPEPTTTEFLPFEPRPIPEPDVLEEDMAVDAPLLAGVSGLPAILQRTTPVVGGVLGGLAQDIVSSFLRAPQETGLGQLPAIRAPTLCPTAVEKPSTRILRFIKANTGVSVKLSRAKSLIRELGLQNAARCLGISAQEVCQLLIAASPRRRRGISGSDIRIVKRTARRFESLKHDLSHIGGRAAPTHHRRRRHHHAHSHK